MSEKELIEKLKPFAESNYADSTAMQCGTHIKNATKCAEIAQAYAKEIAVEFDKWTFSDSWFKLCGEFEMEYKIFPNREEQYTIFLNQRNK